MKIAEVKKLKPFDRFIYWIKERHAIYLKREAGASKPWTDDEVLQNYFFTNPYREHDKVTKWFCKYIRGPLSEDPRVLFATVCFRWFNLPSTAEVLMADAKWNQESNLITNWNTGEAISRLQQIRAKGEQVFTGAYMIVGGAGKGADKIEVVCKNIEAAYERGQAYARMVKAENSLEKAVGLLTRLPGIGSFMAYEIACDLRYTYLLEKAHDKENWANMGPGAARGMNRLLGQPVKTNCKSWLDHARELLYETRLKLPDMPTLEMREIEHSLCEFDKFERALWQDGKLKRRYDGK